ncbi:formate dehydrogenase major subunit [Salisediminibacterium halotolerans]|uniref:Formate dehydrogenase major subunit n=3 Tax=Salisediminibacterium halotolerans TaxID=517425 RepID=A0A1H9WF02_9BACI|nr:formate dehydrogenase major subunit [Salisediminibacterium haloalkalitolerans]
MTKAADQHLQIAVGSDIALMNGMIKIIIENGWYDERFLTRSAINFNDLKAQTAEYPLEKVAKITGLEEKDIFAAAKTFAKADRAMIAYTLGITEHHCGVNNVFDIANLSLLTGHIGREGTGIMPLRGQNNVQGAGDMGCLPNMLTGAVPVSDDAYRNKIESLWNVTLNPIPGRTQTSVLEQMESGAMKSLYVIGENPLVADVHKNHTTELFKNLDFLVVQDLFLTETAEIADVVLPAKGWAESDGTYTNTDRRIQRVRPAVPAPGEALDDWEILCRLSTKMGYPMHYADAGAIWEEVRMIADHLYGGISHARLDNQGSIQYPCPHEDHPGTTLLHTEFHDSRGKTAPFTPVTYTAPVELPDSEYPLTLTTGRRYEPYNTNTQTRYYPDTVKRKQTEETADIHPLTAEELGIEDGEYVSVASRRGEVTVKARLTEEVQTDLVFMSFHWREVPTNVLTIDEFDPISGTAEYKACAIRIDKLRQ